MEFTIYEYIIKKVIDNALHALHAPQRVQLVLITYAHPQQQQQLQLCAIKPVVDVVVLRRGLPFAIQIQHIVRWTHSVWSGLYIHIPLRIAY